MSCNINLDKNGIRGIVNESMEINFLEIITAIGVLIALITVAWGIYVYIRNERDKKVKSFYQALGECNEVATEMVYQFHPNILALTHPIFTRMNPYYEQMIQIIKTFVNKNTIPEAMEYLKSIDTRLKFYTIGILPKEILISPYDYAQRADELCNKMLILTFIPYSIYHGLTRAFFQIYRRAFDIDKIYKNLKIALENVMIQHKDDKLDEEQLMIHWRDYLVRIILNKQVKNKQGEVVIKNVLSDMLIGLQIMADINNLYRHALMNKKLWKLKDLKLSTGKQSEGTEVESFYDMGLLLIDSRRKKFKRVLGTHFYTDRIVDTLQKFKKNVV
jgi:hypothetical protein